MDGRRWRWLVPLLLQLSSGTQILPDCSLEAYDTVWHSPLALSGCPSSLGSPMSVAFTLHTRAAGVGGPARIFDFVSDDDSSSLSAYVGEDGRFSFEAREGNTSTVTTIFQVVGAMRRFLLTLDAQGGMTVRMDEHSVLRLVQRSGPAQQALTALPRRMMIGGNAQGGERLDGRLEDFWVFAGLVGWNSAALPGELTCWGHPDTVDATPNGTFVDVNVGYVFTCATTPARTLVCWGRQPDYGPETTPPSDLGPVVKFRGGTSHACALIEGGSLRCWGKNHVFTAVPSGQEPWQDVELGMSMACGLAASGKWLCWGYTHLNQTAVPQDLGAASVACGAGHCSYVKEDGSVGAWGSPRDVPSDVGSVADLISGLGAFTCASRADASLRCWGDQDRTFPGQYRTVAAGVSGALCRMFFDGSIACEGFDRSGRVSLQPTISEPVLQTTIAREHICVRTRPTRTSTTVTSSTSSSTSATWSTSTESSTMSSSSSSTTSSESSSTTSSESSSTTSSLSSSTTSSLSSSTTSSASSSTTSSASSSTTSSLSSSTTSSLSSSTWSSVSSSTATTLSSSSTDTWSSTSTESSPSTGTSTGTVTWTETSSSMVTTTPAGSSTTESHTSMLTTEGSAAASMMAERSTSPPLWMRSSDMWSSTMIEASTAMDEMRKAPSTETSTAMGTESTASRWADTSMAPSSDGSTAMARGTASSFAGDMTSTAAVTRTTSSAGREAAGEAGRTTAAESSMSTEAFSPGTAADSAVSSTRSAPGSTRSAPPPVWDGSGSGSSLEEAASSTSSAATTGPGAVSSAAGTLGMGTSPGGPAATTLRAEVASRDAGMQAWQSTALTTQWEGATDMQMAAPVWQSSTTTEVETVTEAARPPETAELEATAEVRQSTEKLLQQLRVSNETVQTSVSPKGAVVSVVRLVPSSQPREASAGDGDVELTVATGRSSRPITVVIPGKLMRNLTAGSDDEPVLVVSPVTVLGDNFSSALAGGLEGSPPLGAVQIDLRFLVSGEEIPVTGLEEPLHFTMPPVVYQPGMVCRFYDEELLAWSEEGTGATEDNVPGEVLKCWTRHLSLFAAFLQGFLDVLTCGQFQLLNMEALRRLWRESWYWRPGARIFFAVLTFLGLSFLVSALLDHRRQQSCLWCDEWFLLDVPGPGLTDEDLELMSSECSPDLPLTPTQHRSLILSVVGAVCALFGMLGRQVRESSAVRDALDEIGASWLESFSEVRSFLEGLMQGLEVSASSGTRRLFAVSHGAMCAMVLRTSRRLVGAELRLSDELVAFVLDDAGVRERLCELHRRGGRVSTSSGGSWQACKVPEEMWLGLHHEVCDGMRQQIGVASSWRLLPCSMLKLFLAHSPLGLMWSLNLFRSCKLRAFFFALELVGALLLCALFFQASGGLSAVDEDPACEEKEDPEAAYLFGRLIAISLVSVLVAGLPVSFLHSLQTRHFKRMHQADRARQLRVWRLQDGLVWVLGSLYLAFGLTFFALFLANIGEEDQEELAQQGGLALLQDCVFLPLALAFVGPVLAGALLHATAWAGGMGPRQLLQDVHVSLHRRSNAMLPVMQV